MGLKDFFKNRRLKKVKLKKPPISYNGQGHDLKQAPKISDDELCALWVKCQGCNELLYLSTLKKNNSICKHCDFHHRLSAEERIELITDYGTFLSINDNIIPDDPLKFTDVKPYKKRLEDAQKTTKTKEAIVTGIGNINGYIAGVASMEFQFIGGSMGSVVGEKLTRLVEVAIKKRLPLIIVSSSGGARMHEGILSLMQMAKTSSALKDFHEANLLYISILTEPTFGGVTASFAMLGDIIIAEPRARIGFAGRRVIEETIRQKLPKEFQTAEYLLENGQIDMIVHRNGLKNTLSDLLRLHLTNHNNATSKDVFKQISKEHLLIKI
ncbi:MAG: acetyl-CoA carboxylase carboxyltransferase subunit beta [Candidatus Melainabacteria bacterium]|nr:acetyl-CoA carboxylase carboxyltransferase subunit beta [Candidatus Melainabacteria bacterium]